MIRTGTLILAAAVVGGSVARPSDASGQAVDPRPGDDDAPALETAAERSVDLHDPAEDHTEPAPGDARDAPALPENLEARLYLEERPDVLGEAATAHRDETLARMLVERERLVVARREQAIALLEAFVAEEPEETAEMPDALLRLAELRWEEARGVYLAAFGRWQGAPDDRRGPPPTPDYTVPIALYDRILDRHPGFRRTDLVLYMKAYALLEASRKDQALALYRRILDEHPDSRFVPDAHFALAEDAFGERADWEVALARYDQVLAYPETAFFDIALFKGAWCLWRLGRTEEAAVRFRRVLDLARETQGISVERRRRLQELEDEALDYLIQVFVEDESNTARDVFAFLGDIGGERYAYRVLGRLSETFYGQSRWERGIEAYELLLEMDPTHPEAPSYQRQVAEGWAALDDPERTIAALAGLAERYGAGSTWASQQGDPQRVEAAARLGERSLRRRALRWHEEGQRDDRRDRFEQAAALYGVYLDHYEDRPPAYTLQFYRAEIFFHRLERWAEAGDAYLAAARMNPEGELTRDALYNAVGAFEEVREEGAGEGCVQPEASRGGVSAAGPRDGAETTREGDPADGGPVDGAGPPVCGETENDRKLAAALGLYVELFPEDPDLPEILFRQGKLYYDRRVFDPAVRLFGQLIERFPASPYAETAGELVLDSFNQAQDWGNIETWARRLKETPAFAAPDEQRRLDGLILQAVFKTGEQLAERGEHGKAAEAYLRAADEFPADERAPQAFFNAGLERQRDGDLAGAEEAYGKLVERHRGSEVGADGAWAAAQMYESIAQFDDAARWYETYAQDFPDAPKRADALYNATLLRVTTGDHDEAVTNGERFLDRHSRHEAADDVVFLTARAEEAAGRSGEAARLYRRYIRATRNLDRKVEALTRLGQVLAGEGDARGADRALSEAVRLGKRNYRRLEEGLYFAAQARFLQAEAVLRDYEAVSIAGDPAGLRRRLEEKSQLLARAARVLAEVVEFEVSEWVTAALFKIGRSYELFAEALREAPVPEGLTEEEEQVYFDELAMYVIPIEERALEAYEGGYAKAVALRIYNRWTAELREALTRLNDIAHPPLRETGIALVEGERLPLPAPIEGVVRRTAPGGEARDGAPGSDDDGEDDDGAGTDDDGGRG